MEKFSFEWNKKQVNTNRSFIACMRHSVVIMSFTPSVLIGMVHGFNHQRPESTEDLQYRIMMKKKRFWYFGSIYMTFVFTMMNGIVLDTKLPYLWD